MNGQGVKGKHRLNTQTLMNRRGTGEEHLPDAPKDHTNPLQNSVGWWVGVGRTARVKMLTGGGGVRDGSQSPNKAGRREAEVETLRRPMAGAKAEVLKSPMAMVKAEALVGWDPLEAGGKGVGWDPLEAGGKGVDCDPLEAGGKGVGWDPLEAGGKGVG